MKHFLLRHIKFSAFLVVLIVTLLYLNYRERAPIDITYCLEIKDPRKTSSYECPNKKTLRIPAAYFGLTDPKNPNNPYTNLMLEVDYPSMKPWSSVPWMERWFSQKIEIQIVSLTKPRDAKDFRAISYAKEEIKLMSETPYGLEYYSIINNDRHIFQPLDKNRLISISCAYNADPRINVGCNSRTFISFRYPQVQLPTDAKLKFGLHVKYHFKRVLLPDWEDIHVEIASLFESFETVN